MADDPQGEVEIDSIADKLRVILQSAANNTVCVLDGHKLLAEFSKPEIAAVRRALSEPPQAALRPSAGAGEIEALRTRREWEGKWHKALMTACVIAGGSGAGSPTECVEEIRNALTAPAPGVPNNPNQPHLIDGEFQSDKYPTTPRGKVPLSVKDKTAQDLLWEYAQRRRAVDEQFGDDLETALTAAGYVHAPAPGVQTEALRNVDMERLTQIIRDGMETASAGEIAFEVMDYLSALPAPGVREAMDKADD